MPDAWQTLLDAGLPLSGVRRSATPPVDAIARAVREGVASAPAGREADALAAFVFAWRHHWPECFSSAFGDDATGLLGWAGRHREDPNRYLKLRRIALARLAEVL